MFCEDFDVVRLDLFVGMLAFGTNDGVQDIWQWSELTSFGDLPSSRDFTAASAIGNRKIVM